MGAVCPRAPSPDFFLTTADIIGVFRINIIASEKTSSTG